MDRLVYFFCHSTRPALRNHYHHALVGFAEGLHQLGIKTASNVDYWFEPHDGKPLLRHDPAVSPEDAELLVVDHEWFWYADSFPAQCLAPKPNQKTLFFDHDDGTVTHSWDAAARRFDVIAKSHMVSSIWYPANVTPDTFSLTGRIITAVADTFGNERRATLLSNSRVGHMVRDLANSQVVAALPSSVTIDATVEAIDAAPQNPAEASLWHQTGYRHRSSYFQRLTESRACAAFGGGLIGKFPTNPAIPLRMPHRAVNRVFSRRLVQWDSWRFWESLVAGCVTLQLDFDKAECRLPVPPVNGVHYLGFELESKHKWALDVLADSEACARIGEDGRAFALEHYSAEPRARRILQAIGW